MTLCKLRGSHLTIQRKQLPGAPPASWPGTFLPFSPSPQWCWFSLGLFSDTRTGFPHHMTSAEQNIWVVMTQVSREQVANLNFKEPYLPPQVLRSFSTRAALCFSLGGARFTQERPWAISPSPLGEPSGNLQSNRTRWRLSQERSKSDHDQKATPACTMESSFPRVVFLIFFFFSS